MRAAKYVLGFTALLAITLAGVLLAPAVRGTAATATYTGLVLLSGVVGTAMTEIDP